MLIVGKTGVGKTTLLHGLAGNKLKYSHLTKDYQPINNELLNKFKIGNTMMS
jgi:GTPase SAR1 family protein